MWWSQSSLPTYLARSDARQFSGRHHHGRDGNRVTHLNGICSHSWFPMVPEHPDFVQSMISTSTFSPMAASESETFDGKDRRLSQWSAIFHPRFHFNFIPGGETPSPHSRGA